MQSWKYSLCPHVSFLTCVWGVPPGHIVACWGSRLGSKGKTQTACPAACSPVCWICGMPAAATVSCPVDRSPSPGGSYAGSGRRRCVHMACPAAAPAAAGRCGTPGRRPPPAGSCKDGSPSCGGSGHTQDTEPPKLAPLDPPRNRGCPSLLLRCNSALAQMTPVGQQCWEHTLLSHKLHRMNKLQRGQMPPSGWWHITLQVRGQNKRVKQLFRKNNKCLIMRSCIYSCGKCFVHVYPCVCMRLCEAREWHCVCLCMCVCVSECVEIMYCCSCPLIWQYNLSFALACCNLPIPQRGNYLGLRQREDTDQRKSGSGKQQRGENRASERSRGTEWGWRNERKKQSYYSFVFLIRFLLFFWFSFS